MKSSSSTFTTEAGLRQNTPLKLVEFSLNGTTTLYMALWDQDITFDSQVYTATRGSFSPVPASVDAEIPTLSVELDNVAKEWVDYISNNNLQGRSITIKTVFLDQLGDADAFISELFYVNDYVVSSDKAVFKIGPAYNVLQVKLPRRSFNRYFCPFRYRQLDTCGYDYAVGIRHQILLQDKTFIDHTGLATCDKSYDGPNGCNKHFVGTIPKRFGSFPTKTRDSVVF